MSTLTLRHHRRSLVYDAMVGGLLAGVIVDAFLFATGILTWPRSYNVIASALVGKAAFTSSAFVPLGISIHFAISAAWGALFGLAAQRYGRVARHPFISGLTFGVIVMIVMQMLLAAVGLFRPPQSAGQVMVDIVAHTVFFGVPIAWYVSRTARR